MVVTRKPGECINIVETQMFGGQTPTVQNPDWSIGQTRIRLICTKLCHAGDEDTHCYHCFYQREGMGLLQQSARPCLPCMTDGCVLLLYNSSQKLHQKRQTVRPVHHIQNNTSCLVTLLQPPRRAAVLSQSSSLLPHWYHLEIQQQKTGRSRSCLYFCWQSIKVQMLNQWQTSGQILKRINR